MQKYRIKASPAIIVEAEALTAENVDNLANWCQGQIVQEGKSGETYYEAINVKTPNGKERLHLGMYLMKFGNDFYTVAPVNFEMKYEAIDAVSPPPAPTVTYTNDPWNDIPRIGDLP